MIKYPIVETFASIQGEGRWMGTPMFFIRFAGCPVSDRGTCTAWDGTLFLCDTDLKTRGTFSCDELVERAGDWRRICLTGGEPLAQNLEPLMRALDHAHPRVFHIETSGTVLTALPPVPTWLTVSPKRNYIHSMLGKADEIKVMVTEATNMKRIHDTFTQPRKTLICPVNRDTELNYCNVAKCTEFVLKHPEYTLGFQLHKVIGVR